VPVGHKEPVGVGAKPAAPRPSGDLDDDLDVPDFLK
jgi:hypothetical protein